MPTKRGQRKRIEGKIVSDGADKTIVVEIDLFRSDEKYKKIVKRTRRYKAHDEKNQYRVGEVVIIEESRPYSKDKKWRVIKKISKK